MVGVTPLGTFLIGLVCLLLPSCLFAQTVRQIPWEWNNLTYTTATANISILPAGQFNLFSTADHITVSNNVASDPVRVLDQYGTLVYSGMTAHALGTLPVGHYFVESPSNRVMFAVLPADCPSHLSLQMTANLGLFGAADDHARMAIRPAWSIDGVHAWNIVATNANWTWPETMAQALTNREAGSLKLLFEGANWVPDWITPKEPFSAYTNAVVLAYSNWVYRVLSDWGSHIYAYEVFNEPRYNKFRVHNDVEATCLYLALAKVAKAVRDQVAPQVKLYGPSWQDVKLGYNKLLFDGGILDLLDFWSVHDYTRMACGYAPDVTTIDPSCGGGDWGLYYDLPEQYDRTYGPVLKRGTPIILEEWGLYSQSALGITNTPGPYTFPTPWRIAMTRTIREIVMMKGLHAVSICAHLLPPTVPYWPEENGSINGWEWGMPCENRLRDGVRGPKPSTTVMLLTMNLLEGAQLLDSAKIGPGTTGWRYQFCGADGREFAVVWATEGRVLRNEFPGYQVRDIWGQPYKAPEITDEPVVLTPSVTSPQQLPQE